jgi:hypothetical protein
MKSRPLILLISLVVTMSAKADWVVVQSVENSSGSMHQTNQITLKIKGNKHRIDSGPYASTIMDNDSGDQIVLMHPQRSYMVQSASQLKEGRELMNQMRPQSGTASNGVPQLRATGKTEKINDYQTEEFVWEGAEARGRFWITKNIPNYAALRDAMENSFAETRKMAVHRLPDTKSLPGFPVRSEQIYAMKAPAGLTPEQLRLSGLGQGQTFTNVVTLISVKEEALSESEFTIPNDYSQAGATAGRPPTNAAAGLRDVLKQMEKQGLSEADRKKFEQIIKNAEGQSPKNQK